MAAFACLAAQGCREREASKPGPAPPTPGLSAASLGLPTDTLGERCALVLNGCAGIDNDRSPKFVVDTRRIVCGALGMDRLSGKFSVQDCAGLDFYFKSDDLADWQKANPAPRRSAPQSAAPHDLETLLKEFGTDPVVGMGNQFGDDPAKPNGRTKPPAQVPSAK